MSINRTLSAIFGCLALVTPAIADTVTVTSPSGVYTNPGPTNTNGPGIGYNTWFANNVRNGGSAGITTSHADSGNGSIEFAGPTNAKADFEYYFSPGGGFALSNLTAFSYDVYRSSSSTAAGKYEPSLRLYVSDGAHTGYLVYEGVYNGQLVSPTDQFTTANVMPAYVWSTGTLPDAATVYNRTIADWVALLPNLQVLGFSTGIGSGWDGSFDGSVDNITYATAINGVSQSTTFNFEVASANSPVPEPFSLSLVAIGLAAGAVKRRRRSSN